MYDFRFKSFNQSKESDSAKDEIYADQDPLKSNSVVMHVRYFILLVLRDFSDFARGPNEKLF